eukprot:11022136-Prorocentrum_lima.AAC.1
MPLWQLSWSFTTARVCFRNLLVLAWRTSSIVAAGTRSMCLTASASHVPLYDVAHTKANEKT